MTHPFMSDNLFKIVEFLPLSWRELLDFTHHFKKLASSFAKNLKLENSAWQPHFERIFPGQTSIQINGEVNYKASFKHFYIKTLRSYQSVVPRTLPDSFIHDKIFILNAMKYQGWLYEILEPEFKNDKEVFFCALKQRGLVPLSHAPELKDNKVAVYSSVLKDRGALQYASARLQNDEDVLFAVRHPKLALMWRHKIPTSVALLVFVAFLAPMIAASSFCLTSALIATGLISSFFIKELLFVYLETCEFFPQFEAFNTMKLAFSLAACIIFAASFSGLTASVGGAVLVGSIALTTTGLIGRTNFFSSQGQERAKIAALVAERNAEWDESDLQISCN